MGHYNKFGLATLIAFLSIFYTFVFFYERYEYNQARLRITQHAVVIANSLWNLEPNSTLEYISLACKSQSYKKITVTDLRGYVFQSAESQTNGWKENLFTFLHLIPEVNLKADVIYKENKIGIIKAIWKCDTIYLELYVLFALILSYVVCYLNIRLLHSNNMLEQRVKERTEELSKLMSELSKRTTQLSKRTTELSNVNSSLQTEVEEHRQARKALDQSEDKYRILVENIPDILYRTDMEGVVLFVSPSCESLSGYTAEELIGKKMNELFYTAPDKRDGFIESLEQNGSVNNYEGKLKKKDGSIWWASVNAHFFKDSNGNIAGVEGIFRDVTRRKMLENELRQAQKMESIGTLTGGIAHDFNNILGIMIGNAELAMDELPKWNPVYSKIEAIKTTGLKASGIVKQLLNFSRKTTDMDFKPINIIPIIKESIELLRATIPVFIEIKENIEPDIKAVILGDSTQINQIIMNLCINACHAIEDKDIKGVVEIAVEPTSFADRSNKYSDIQSNNFSDIVQSDRFTAIQSNNFSDIVQSDRFTDIQSNKSSDIVQSDRFTDIQSNKSSDIVQSDRFTDIQSDKSSDIVQSDRFIDVEKSNYVKITVKDNGSGISPAILDRIFEPYFTTKSVDKGTGMGLAVVHGIVKNHNGVITVKSKPLNGTTFTILFPLVEQEPEILYKAPDELHSGKEKILFVDDDEFIVDMTMEMLGRLGYQVISRTDPEEALELFIAEPDDFDLVITDMTMPNMSGAKLAERIREIRSNIPVIVCSGYSSMIDEEKAKETGIAAYIMKPVSMEELGQTIRNVIDKNVFVIDNGKITENEQC